MFKIGIPPFTFYQGKRLRQPRNKVKLDQMQHGTNSQSKCNVNKHKTSIDTILNNADSQ